MPVSNARGRLNEVLRRILMREATVTACEPVAAQFRLITLEGPALREVAWIPGQKVQIAMSGPFVTRTYTPIEWDAVAGSTRILGYMHGDGPGSAWVRNMKPGAKCDVFGPRRSIDVSDVPGTLALFGDETSMGLAFALQNEDRARTIRCYFEVTDLESSRLVITRLPLVHAELFSRTKDEVHLERMEAAFRALVDSDATFVLTGKVSTIQRLKRVLKRHDVPARRVVTKAYWAPGKAGLD
jgi:NADPH-dependent ferric siderophore reductase